MRVSDVGPFGANIMIVGEAPGAEEASQGVPFVGSAGKLLKHTLRSNGVAFENCYVTNIMDTRPPNNKFEYFYTDSKRHEPSQALRAGWSKLQQKVKDLKPNVVIALGAEPLRALTNKRSISKWRGIIIPMLSTKIIATYHPAGVLRQWSWQPIMSMDIAKAKRHSLTRGYTEPQTNIILRPSISDVLSWFGKVGNRVGIDIETIGKNIRCMAFATGSVSYPRAICIPFMKFQNQGGYSINKGVLKIQTGGTETATSYWSAQDELIVLNTINKLLTNSSVEKVGQNSTSFDAPLMKRNFKMVIENHYLDTMHAHHELYSELPMGLDFLTTMYTDYPNYWSDKVTEDDNSEWHYNAMDAIVCYVCSYKIEVNLATANMTDYYFKHRHPLILALADAQYEGLDIDDERRKQLIVEQEEILKDLQQKINTIAKSEVNVNSPAQMKQLLYVKMGFPKVVKDDKVTTDEKALRALEHKYPNEPILDHIIMYRKTKKLVSTYLKAKADEDGKMRTSWNPSGTESGRISSSKTIWKTGLQMQNIPKGISRGVVNIRDIFIAGKTRCLCQSEST